MNQETFLNYFPIPKYLEFPAVGFDISDGSVKFLELLRNNNSITVGRFGRRTFVDNPITVLAAIKKEYNFDWINVSIPEEESFFFRIRLPFIKTEELRGAIELQLEEYIPYSANEVEFDFEILGTDSGIGGYIDVNVSALPKKILKNYMDNFEKSGLRPISLMIEAEATASSAIPSSSQEATMIVNIGRVNTVLSIVIKESVWSSHTFRFGGDLLVNRLQETCNLSKDAAEKIKNEVGLVSSPSNLDVFECMLLMVSGVGDEIKKHRKYWDDNRKVFLRKEDSTDINKIILCGSQSIIPGLTGYLSVALSLQVVQANPWVNIFDFDQYIPPIKYNDSLEYTTAIGLAFRSLK